MIKVMIVDDEFLVRVGMKSALDWENHGFAISAEAADGAEALAICERELPDIILTDIRMPKMDGMELIRAVRQRYPEVQFIILTCLDELSLVKEAMALGASGYFTKIGVDPDEILAVLLRLKQAIELERRKASELETLKQLVVNNRVLLKEQLFQALLHPRRRVGDAVPDDSPLLADPAVMERADRFLLVRVLRSQTLKDTQFFRQSVLDLLEEIAGRRFAASEVFPVAEADFWIGGAQPDGAGEPGAFLTSVARDIEESLRLYLNAQCQIAFTARFRSFGELPEAFHELQAALADPSRSGRIAKGERQPEFKLDDLLEGPLAAALKEGDLDKIRAALEAIFAVASDHGVKLEQLKKIGLQILLGFEKELRRHDQSIDSVCADDIIEQVMSCQDPAELREKIAAGALTIAGALADLRSNTFRRDVKRIIDFLDLHYAEKINLDYAASLAGMNSAYFSRLFKKECGVGFVEFLTRLRMDQAKRLLETSDAKLLEVAEKVGFEDVNYFSKSFKKYTGISPSEYRETHGGF
jgi:two-component system response regulator YesN